MPLKIAVQRHKTSNTGRTITHYG